MSHSIKIQSVYDLANSTKAQQPVIDMHLHADDFCQRTDGFKSLLLQMDQANISKAVVFGLPVKKKRDYFELEEPHLNN